MFICFSLMRWFNIIIIFKAAFKEFQIFSHFSHHLSFSLVVPLTCPMFLWSIDIKNFYRKCLFLSIVAGNCCLEQHFVGNFSSRPKQFSRDMIYFKWTLFDFLIKNTKIDGGWFWYSKFIINDLLGHCWKRSRISC